MNESYKQLPNMLRNRIKWFKIKRKKDNRKKNNNADIEVINRDFKRTIINVLNKIKEMTEFHQRTGIC